MQGAQVRKVSPPTVILFDRPWLPTKSWGLVHPGILATVTVDTHGYGDVSLLPITQLYVGGRWDGWSRPGALRPPCTPPTACH